jgi:hypothetical protein
MNKIYLLSIGLMLFSLSIFAQTTQKSDKKTPIETPKITQEIVYCIDGAITKSPLDFLKIKQEDIYSIAIVNDQAEIAKSYARKGESFKSVIVVQTIKTSRPKETVASENGHKEKIKKN